MKPETVKALRTQFESLVEVLEADGVCTDRDCMCETAAPVVKLNAAIAELEQEVAAQAKADAINKSYRRTPDQL